MSNPEGDLVHLAVVASDSAVAILAHRAGRREECFDRVEAVFCARNREPEGIFAGCKAAPSYCDERVPLLIDYVERWIRFRCADLEVELGDLGGADAVWLDRDGWKDHKTQVALLMRVHLDHPKLFDFTTSRMTPSLLFDMWKEATASLARVETGLLGPRA